MFLGIFFSLQRLYNVAIGGNLYIQLVRGLVLGADGEYLLKGIFSTNFVGGYKV